MKVSESIQLLACLMVCVSSAHGIMVKYGTKDGPIEPPAPEPSLPAPQPYRVPAPVWEERSNDTPDPNAQWRPRVVNPHPRYTHIIYKTAEPAPSSLTNAQHFVNSYIPDHRPIKAEPIKNLFTPAQILGSQSLAGVGLRYFVPFYPNEAHKKKQTNKEDEKLNSLDTNEVDTGSIDSTNDLEWKLEKDAAKRNVRHTQQEAVVPVYQWNAYILPRYR